MIANEVEHHQMALAFVASQASAELLQEQDLGFGRAQHHDGIDAGDINSLIEQVDAEQHLQGAGFQLFQCLRAPEGRV